MSYTVEKIREDFINACEMAGVQFNTDIEIEINSRLTRCLGRVCSYRRGNTIEPVKIQFSKKLIENAEEEKIHQIILHEAAHYICIERTHTAHKHDEYFKKVCAEIGAEFDGCSIDPSEIFKNSSKAHKFTIYCEDCKEVVGYRDRACKTIANIQDYRCKKCKGEHLKVIKNW